MPAAGPYIYLVYFLLISISASIYSSEVSGSSRQPKSQITIQVPVALKHLASTTILSTLHSTDRRLWLATLDGVTQVGTTDDRKFSHFTNRSGDKVRFRARHLIEVWDGEIFALTTDNKAVSLQRGGSNFVSADWLEAIGGDTDELVEAYFSPKNLLWLAYENGKILAFSSRGRRLSIVRTSGLGIPSDIFGTYEGGVLVSFSSNKVLSISMQGKIDKKFNTDGCFGLRNISELAKLGNGEVIMGSRGGGIFFFDSETENCEAARVVDVNSENVQSSNVHDIELLEDKKTTLVGTDQGLLICTSEGACQEHASPFHQSLSDVISISRDSKGSAYWIGTYKGIFRLIQTPFQLFGTSTSPLLQSIVGFAQAENDGTLIASYHGLALLKPNSEQVVSIDKGRWETDFVREGIMTLYHHNEITYLGYRNLGFEILHATTPRAQHWDLSKVDGLRSNSISSFLKTNEGELLLGTYGQGIAILDVRRRAARHLTTASGDSGEEQILFIFQSSDGTIWVGTEAGLRTLSLVDNKLVEVTYLNASSDMAENPIIWSANETDNFVWFGSMHDGLFKHEKSRHLPTDTGAIVIQDFSEISYAEKAIYSIEKGLGEEIWFSTNQGIARRTSIGKVVQYGEENGVDGIGFELNSSFQDVYGYLYFGGVNGFYKFHPHDIGDGPSPATMFLNDIVIGGRKIHVGRHDALSQSITLSHKDRFLSFEFSTRDLTNPGSTRYRYKLEGFDDDWVDVGNRGSATYTNLPAGDYVFRAQALNASGIWNLSGISLDVEVKPAPWRTWWAYTLYTLFLLGIAYLLLRIYREQMLKKQALEQAREMQRVADHFADELLDQMDIQRVLTDSIHRYNKELLAWANTCIQRTAEYAQGDMEALRSGTDYRLQILDLVQDALYYRGEELYLDPSAFVGRLFGSAARRYPNLNQRLIAVNDATSELLPATQAIPLAIIIGELFENSMSHGFSQSAGACCVRVVVNMPSIREVYLEYHDDGAGIPEGLSFEAAEFAGFSIAAEAAKAANGKLEISPDRQTVHGNFSLSGEMHDLDQRP